MKTYNTYQEAKIENPTEDIYFNGAFKWFGCNGHNMLNVCWVKCNPEDYCMTVEKFLGDGYTLVDGDLWLSHTGKIQTVGLNAPASDVNLRSNLDCERFILRAAALGRSNCTPSIHADSEFYKKPRTRVEYVKIKVQNAWEVVKEFEDGCELYTKQSHEVFTKIENVRDVVTYIHRLYRKVETEIDERQEFVDAACAISEKVHGERRQYVFEALFDSGKFKYIGGDDADE